MKRYVWREVLLLCCGALLISSLSTQNIPTSAATRKRHTVRSVIDKSQYTAIVDVSKSPRFSYNSIKDALVYVGEKVDPSQGQYGLVRAFPGSTLADSEWAESIIIPDGVTLECHGKIYITGDLPAPGNYLVTVLGSASMYGECILLPRFDDVDDAVRIESATTSTMGRGDLRIIQGLHILSGIDKDITNAFRSYFVSSLGLTTQPANVTGVVINSATTNTPRGLTGELEFDFDTTSLRWKEQGAADFGAWVPFAGDATEDLPGYALGSINVTVTYASLPGVDALDLDIAVYGEPVERIVIRDCFSMGTVNQFRSDVGTDGEIKVVNLDLAGSLVEDGTALVE